MELTRVESLPGHSPWLLSLSDKIEKKNGDENEDSED